MGIYSDGNKLGQGIPGSGSAGVSSFNGRSGAVTPQTGDYNSSQITHENTSVEAKLTALQTALEGKAEDFTYDWSTLPNKPETFAPTAHTHTKDKVGLNNVDNTSDADKPISTATQTALNAKLDASKIVITDTAPTVGSTSSYPNGTVILVYEV